ncbi:MAG: VWA-like domain-containing protein [bacterium]|nr:VWA-like domain-containing protein [bacterium]
MAISGGQPAIGQDQAARRTKREAEVLPVSDNLHIDEMMQRYIDIAVEVLEECRDSLMMAFRFLDVALWKMPYGAMSSPFPLGTNGKVMLFTPRLVLTQFIDFPKELVRDYLHTQLHCIFRHPFDTEHDDSAAWSLTCDIVVEAIAIEMAGKRFPSEIDPQRLEAIDRLTTILGKFTPARLYRAFVLVNKDVEAAKELGISPTYMWDLKMIFERDCHDFWASSKIKPPDVGSSSQPGKQDSQGQSEQRQEAEGEEDEASNAGDGEDDSRTDDEGSEGEGSGENILTEEEREISQEEWEEIAKQIETDLESFSKAWGDNAGNLVATLAIANRKKRDYADFLKRFAVLNEEMKINDDEFDYIYYTYGIDHYGNMPLVEPLEYMETNRVRDFVIAIDTSGSTSGPLVENFIYRTYEILHQSESFSDRINIHIVQCDERIQRDTKVTNIRELEEYANSFEIRGHGGTDFRPVFQYVDELLAQGEFDDLRGLIYFTDGQGTYPTKMPEYDTAFVFLDDRFDRRAVPPWAMKIVLDEDQVREL